MSQDAHVKEADILMPNRNKYGIMSNLTKEFLYFYLACTKAT